MPASVISSRPTPRATASGGDDEPDGGLPAAAEGQPQAEADHDTTRSGDSEVTLPSRTMTSRSA